MNRRNLAMTDSLFVIVRCKSDNWMEIVSAVYGPNHSVDRGDFWNEIQEVQNWKQLLWIIGGDFNFVHFA